VGAVFCFPLNEKPLVDRNLIFVAREWNDMSQPFELTKN
jgi:hypothetical protein